MNIAIIPARGGSKRIPEKNIRPFFGKPIIQYSITAAVESGLFDRIIVSTDSKKIADLSVLCGADVPFIRPAEISDDLTPIEDVVHHALTWLQAEQESYEYACCILATAPFLSVEYLKKGIEIIKEKKASSAFSTTSYSFPIFRALKITEEGRLRMFWPEHKLTRSNDLPEAYHDAGQFYWLKISNFIKTKEIYTSDAVPVIIPRFMAQDIDTEEDWETAENLYQINKNQFKELCLVPATLKDADILLKWRNDQATRMASKNKETISQEEHIEWLKASLKNANRLIFIAREEGIPIGVVRADKINDTHELSWTVDPDARGRGLGKKIVSILVNSLPLPVSACVNKGNEASIKIAEYAGMKLFREDDEFFIFRRDSISND